MKRVFWIAIMVLADAVGIGFYFLIGGRLNFAFVGLLGGMALVDVMLSRLLLRRPRVEEQYG